MIKLFGFLIIAPIAVPCAIFFVMGAIEFATWSILFLLVLWQLGTAINKKLN